MTFTFTSDLTGDVDYVRFHTGDTNEGEAFLSDELITSLVAQEGSTQGAVIAAIRYIIAQLSKPNFKADWLSLDYKSAREGYQALLNEKLKEFGRRIKQATHTPVYRKDEEDS